MGRPGRPARGRACEPVGFEIALSRRVTSFVVPAPLDPGLSPHSASGSMLPWNALRAAGFEPSPTPRTISSLVPAPLDPGLSPHSASGSMLPWNALRAAGFEACHDSSLREACGFGLPCRDCLLRRGLSPGCRGLVRYRRPDLRALPGRWRNGSVRRHGCGRAGSV